MKVDCKTFYVLHKTSFFVITNLNYQSVIAERSDEAISTGQPSYYSLSTSYQLMFCACQDSVQNFKGEKMMRINQMEPWIGKEEKRAML